MENAIDEIRFLANSPNRVSVLNALTSGTATRQDLQDETGVARSTVARALDEAETRGWVESEGSRYGITPLGEAMVSEFSAFVETVDGIRHLGAAVDWLPDPVHDLDFRHFRDADVTTPTEANPTAPFDRGLELVRTADEYRGLTENSFPEYMKVVHDRVERGRLAFEGVIQADFVETVRAESKRRSRWRDIAHRMWLYDGQVPVNMHVVDETVAIWLCDENRDGADVIVKGLLESDHPAVVSWAESLFEEYRDAAEPLEPTVLFPE